jgi:hypothetical protein
MSNIRGRFYFIQKNKRNLIGEFSNNESNFISTESADKVSLTIEDDFIGDYRSSWQENGESLYSDLKIRYKNGTSQTIFSLDWNRNGLPIFVGEGMLCDNILIGDYQSK